LHGFLDISPGGGTTPHRNPKPAQAAWANPIYSMANSITQTIPFYRRYPTNSNDNQYRLMAEMTKIE